MSQHKLTCATIEYAGPDEALHRTWLHDSETYRRTWPKHCMDCGGWGKLEGVGVNHAPGVELCDACLSGEICPRCAREPLLAHDDPDKGDWYSCVGCGWLEDTTHGLSDEPTLARCDCWSLDDIEESVSREATE